MRYIITFENFNSRYEGKFIDSSASIPHQIEANAKINECFNSTDKRCLLAHKPRSGKTFTTIYNIKENNYKNVVIL